MNLFDILKDKKICYPQGAGGSWLINLLDILCKSKSYNQQDYLNVINFHSEWDDTFNKHKSKSNDDIIFSDRQGFNFYLNFWWKKRVYENYNNFNDKTDYKKIEELSQEARWILYSEEYTNMYLNKADIQWRWIWNDIDKFIDSIESILNQKLNTRQKDIVSEQIEIYKQSNVNPVFHFHNYNSIPWLAWGYAVLIEKKINLDFKFYSSEQIPLLAKQLLEHNELIAKETMPRLLLI